MCIGLYVPLIHHLIYFILIMAIMVHSFLSLNNILHYQAGAGIVADSDLQSELNEVNNKMMALRKALEMVEKL